MAPHRIEAHDGRVNGSSVATPLSLEGASSLPNETVLERLGTDIDQGLSVEEATQRLRTFGPNAIPAHHARGLALLLRQFKSPLLLLLIGASVVSALLGDPSDAIIIGVIVALSVGLGFANEFRAARRPRACATRSSTPPSCGEAGGPSRSACPTWCLVI